MGHPYVDTGIAVIQDGGIRVHFHVVMMLAVLRVNPKEPGCIHWRQPARGPISIILLPFAVPYFKLAAHDMLSMLAVPE